MISNIKKTIAPYNIKEIRRLNMLLVGLTFPFTLILLFLFEEMLSALFFLAIKTACYMFITSNLLVWILKFSAKKFPDDLFKFQFCRFTLSYISGIAIYLSLWPIFSYLAKIPSHLQNYKLLAAFIAISIVLTTIILFLHNFVIFRQNKIQTELENSRLQLRSTQAENLLLKQQIHPHFLFNSLNTLKALYKKDPKLGEIYLLQLADFLRSAVSLNNSHTTTLAEELEICKNYMEMQKIRFGEALEWNLKIEKTEMLKGFVPSFSLQPLLENAIKHNILTKESPLKLLIEQHDNYISVFNAINPRNAGETSTKSGLSNLAERYQLWTEEEIIIKNDGKSFSVSFKIMPHENSNN
ncbi:sensor histidine kinase [Flavobacterium daemonense]|uniref:sensor histidine kinase n=1 Tax=Flavobacterium daemonense TaxID=1393049 RepID=UPI00118632F3|nr:histidine kinase [Flavobacterium daemonense]KAF2336843.1 histidine kinase [Flavobacterium daemonense]